ncbi:MAG: hypothetical protein SFU86_00105 [Pirellulaceae bacterium]|nr:hypothetical protein [Pirellulaceae bacterium]
MPRLLSFELRLCLLVLAGTAGCCGIPSHQYGAAAGGACASGACGPQGCGPSGCGRMPGGCHEGHPPLLALKHSFVPQVPPGEQVPMPKFHPVPTRPVFEPEPLYPPLAHGATIPSRFSQAPASGEPTLAPRR